MLVVSTPVIGVHHGRCAHGIAEPMYCEGESFIGHKPVCGE